MGAGAPMILSEAVIDARVGYTPGTLTRRLLCRENVHLARMYLAVTITQYDVFAMCRLAE